MKELRTQRNYWRRQGWSISRYWTRLTRILCSLQGALRWRRHRAWVGRVSGKLNNYQRKSVSSCEQGLHHPLRSLLSRSKCPKNSNMNISSYLTLPRQAIVSVNRSCTAKKFLNKTWIWLTCWGTSLVRATLGRLVRCLPRLCCSIAVAAVRTRILISLIHLLAP